MQIKASNVPPEVVAAIAAAVQMMMTREKKKLVAVRIKRSDTWALSTRGGLIKNI